MEIRSGEEGRRRGAEDDDQRVSFVQYKSSPLYTPALVLLLCQRLHRRMEKGKRKLQLGFLQGTIIAGWWLPHIGNISMNNQKWKPTFTAQSGVSSLSFWCLSFQEDLELKAKSSPRSLPDPKAETFQWKLESEFNLSLRDTSLMAFIK